MNAHEHHGSHETPQDSQDTGAPAMSGHEMPSDTTDTTDTTAAMSDHEPTHAAHSVTAAGASHRRQWAHAPASVGKYILWTSC